MEGKKNKLVIFILLMVLGVFTVNAQKKDLSYYQCALFESYRTGNMAPWPVLIDEMEKAKSSDLTFQSEMVKAMYGLVGYQIGARQKDKARVYVDKASDYLDQLLEKYPQNAQLHSLAGAFYGYKIALAFYKAPFLGPKSLSHIEKAIALDPKEPMGYTEKGNSLLYRPAAFGGDKMEALALYRKALHLMEQNKHLECNWQYMLLRATILKTLYETNQEKEANAFREAMEKDYGSMIWIKSFVGAELMQEK
jgi:tetratricopeptide (TPR) repeat protein